MTTRTSYDPGTPCWIDLTSPDTDASTAFYSGLFGWDAEDQHDPDGNHIYTNFSRDGQLVAGMAPQQPEMAGMPPIWNTYVATSDVDTTTKKVEEAGGTVMLPPMDVMTQGRMAVYADPSGAVVSAWQPGEHVGAAVCNEADAWSWNELMSRDLDRALAFYTDVFGWHYDPQDMPGGMTYHVVEGGDEGGLGGLMDMPDEISDEVPSYWGVYFTVDDCDATVDRARELGGGVLMEPMDMGGVGRMATLHDPMGGTFNVMQPAPAG